MITLRVNGKIHHLDIDPETPLLWVLNENLGLTGTKYSCGIEECGACTVLIDGEASLSCRTPVHSVENADIVTIEGFDGRIAQALRKAWIEEDVVQCGYCQPGQILTAASLLTNNPAPDEQAIKVAMSDVLCRCGTYQRIGNAIRLVVGEMQDDGS